MFRSISNQPVGSKLGSLEGCYLHYDAPKNKWIRSGKASGAGKDACFDGRGNTHTKNARSIVQMRQHRFYQEYPAKGVDNIGGIGGHFDNLEVFCGMAFDKTGDVTPLCSEGEDKSLFVWSKQCTDALKKRDGSVGDNKLLAIAYLWETCYDLLLAKCDNVSSSPGFEALGLRIN